ncbi:MAG: hypothetical protein AB2731_11565 [Candidatus Thiodiazotropha sp.]
MNIEVLKYIIDYENSRLNDLVSESSTSMDAAIGVAKILLANNGDTSVLKGKQTYVFERCIDPLFHISCEGIYGEGTCTGDGMVDEESLLLCYQEDMFLCQHCRFDKDKIESD